MGIIANQGYCEGLELLLKLKAPSRLAAKDATLFSFDASAEEQAASLMGWTTLCANPPKPIREIAELAAQIRAEGLDTVVLIGQGGSTQASMTITKLHELESNRVAFKTMDSLSPVFVNHILGSSDPARTLYILSSKSGSTVEPVLLERVVWHYVSAHLGAAEAGKRFVAITDPDSELEQHAREKNYRAVLHGPIDVGGRYSAMSVFALFPMALVGIDIEAAIEETKQTELLCSQDNTENPALILSCFLYDCYQNGRDKFSLVLPPSGQVLGLWIEQLVAESLGKQGKGILPNVEVDASVLSFPYDDRSAICYAVGHDEGYHESICCINSSIPVLNFSIERATQVLSHFVIWEFAITFLGIMMEVNPFDQPDVELTKTLVKDILYNDEKAELPAADADTIALYNFSDDSNYVRAMRISRSLLDEEFDATIDQALRRLLGSLESGDYFSLNAFLPFRGIGRREALERMRNRVASRLGAVSCLEIGPRYLHSTGQLHKGGPNNGVFLLLSAEEENDIAIPQEDFTLGELAIAQAQGDFEALASRGRRTLHIHLCDNDSETLSRFADRFCAAVSAIKV